MGIGIAFSHDQTIQPLGCVVNMKIEMILLFCIVNFSQEKLFFYICYIAKTLQWM